MSTELQYNPLFVPGDILKADFPEKSIVCLITASVDAGAVEGVPADHPVRYYHALYFSDANGFVHYICMENYLKKYAERIGHLNWNMVTCGGTDAAEVLSENKALRERLDKMTEARDYWQKKYSNHMLGIFE